MLPEWEDVVEEPYRVRRREIEIQVRPLLLFGEYELTIDEKNRLLIPSEIRRQLDPERDGEAFFLVTGVNKRPWFYVERLYEQLAARRDSELTPLRDAIDFDLLYYAKATRLELDKQGRVLIPDKVMKKIGVGRDVTLVGGRDHLQLWNRTDWDRHSVDLEERRGELSVLIRQQPPAQP